MAAELTTRLLTAEQFLIADLGEGTFELVRGEVDRMSPPVPEHGVICGTLAGLLWDYGRRSGLGYCLSNKAAVLTLRDLDTVRRPDICFYSHARWPRSEAATSPPVVPDLVVEVSTHWSELGAMNKRVGEYLYAGVPLVWGVYLQSLSLVLYRSFDTAPVVLQDHQTIEELPELPGFRCLVSDVFR